MNDNTCTYDPVLLVGGPKDGQRVWVSRPLPSELYFAYPESPAISPLDFRELYTSHDFKRVVYRLLYLAPGARPVYAQDDLCPGCVVNLLTKGYPDA